MMYLVEELSALDGSNMYRRLISSCEMEAPENIGYYLCTSIKVVPWEDWGNEENLIYLNLEFDKNSLALQKIICNRRMEIAKRDFLKYLHKPRALVLENYRWN